MTAVARRAELDARLSGTERLFRLGTGHLEEVEAFLDRGALQIFDRAYSGKWKIAEMRAVLTHGLIGAGETPTAARDLVEAAIDAQSLFEIHAVARDLIGVALLPDLAGEVAEAGKSKKKPARGRRIGSRSGS